jgi:TetR/AcrR family transcriptional regulator, repressor for neighboring sulfatase
MAAVLDATVELLAEAGPRTLSVRQVAERAGVNHALVHRHFGTKDEIVRRALETQAAAVAQDVRVRSHQGTLDVAEVLEVLAEHTAYWATLARVVLDDPELAGRGAAPTTGLFASAARREGTDPGTTALAACLMLGRQVFGDFVVEATGITPEDLDTDVSQVLRSLLGR